MFYIFTQNNESIGWGLAKPKIPWYQDKPAPKQNIPTPLINEETFRKLLHPYLTRVKITEFLLISLAKNEKILKIFITDGWYLVFLATDVAPWLKLSINKI